MKIESRILSSIKQRAGAVILRRDVTGMGSPSQVSASLKALQTKGIIVRVSAGVFVKSSIDSGVGTSTLTASAGEIASEVFQKLGIDMQVEGDADRLTLNTGVRRIRRRLSIGGKAVVYAAQGKNRPVGLLHPIPKIDVSRFVKNLARKHHIVYSRTAGDDWAETVTRLAGDEVHSDSTGNLLVALTRAKKLTDREMSALLINHLREKRGVRSG